MASHAFNKGILHAQAGTYSPVAVWVVAAGAADVNADGFTISKGAELVSSIAKTGGTGGTEGSITLTLKQPYKNLLFASAEVVSDDGTYYKPKVSAYDVSSAKTVTIQTRAEATNALTDVDGETIAVHLVLEN